MEIRYQLFENENFFVQKFSGTFSLDVHMKYTRFIMPFLTKNSIEKVLNDFRDLKFGDMNNIPDDYTNVLEKVADFRKKIERNELKNREVSLVFWVDDPIPTLTAHLFLDNFSNKNYSYCSSEAEIKKFLQLPDHLNMKNLTEHLKNIFKLD